MIHRFRTSCVFETLVPVVRVTTYLLYVLKVTVGGTFPVCVAIVSLIIHLNPSIARVLMNRD